VFLLKLEDDRFLEYNAINMVIIALMIEEAVRTSETSLYFNKTTLRCIPESFHSILNAVRI
jgi:hypothetical protein